jgi:pimeloyl-ACP methyl ester carboxylesterase
MATTERGIGQEKSTLEAPAPVARWSRTKRAALVGVVTVLVSVLGLGGALLLMSPGTPEPFLGSDGRPLAGSISEKTWVSINGVKQGMVIRGENTANPVLLVVHGGPGMPDYFLTDQYPTQLEDLFTVVWWDQRGAALSYRPDIPPASMTVEQFISDTLAVTDYLRQRFHQDKIYLLGHSWGSFIGIQAAARAPEKYRAYLGMAQMVHQLESEKIAYDYMLAEYQRLGDTGMVRDLEAAPVSMTTGTPKAYLDLRDKAMHQIGIGTTHDMKSVITGVFLSSWKFRGYTLKEKLDLWKGRSFSRSFGLWEQILRVDLRTTLPRLQVPVYFFEGAYDYTCYIGLARDYLRKLDAPVKGFYVFDRSAHSSILEQPADAHRILQEDVLTSTNAHAEIQ